MQAVTIKRICDTQQQRSYNVYPSRFDEAIRRFAAASLRGTSRASQTIIENRTVRI